MQTISINFIVPQGWHELGDKQLRYVYELIAQEFDIETIKTLCLLRWSDTKVIGNHPKQAASILDESQDVGGHLIVAAPRHIRETIINDGRHDVDVFLKD